MKRAFTIMEVLVVLTILALLLGMLLSVLSAGKEASENAYCMTNLRTMGQGVEFLKTDNRGLLPVGEGFWDSLATALDTKPYEVSGSPRDNSPWQCNSDHIWGVKTGLSYVYTPAEVVLLVGETRADLVARWYEDDPKSSVIMDVMPFHTKGKRKNSLRYDGSAGRFSGSLISIPAPF